MNRDEIKLLNDLQKSVNSLMGTVCAIYGVISQIPGVENMDAAKAVAIGNTLLPGGAVFHTQSTSEKIVNGLLSQAKAHHDENLKKTPD